MWPGLTAALGVVVEPLLPELMVMKLLLLTALQAQPAAAVTLTLLEPPLDPKGGGIIKNKVNSELDHLRKIVNGSRDFLLELEKKEREKTRRNAYNRSSFVNRISL